MFRLILFLPLIACSGDKGSTDDADGLGDTAEERTEPGNRPGDDNGESDTDTDVDADTDADADTGTADMPENPAPFTLTLSDGSTLNFDLPSCNHYRGSPNFRFFWRDAARTHTYVLTIEVMTTFTGAGSYSSPEHTARIKMQEEAPQTGAPAYWTDSSAGDPTTIEVDYIDDEVAWGQATLDTMHNLDSGAIVTVTPTELPIWCPDVEI